MAADQAQGSSPVENDRIVRRNRRGTRTKDMYNWPEQDFEDMDTVLAGRLLSV